MSAPAITLSVPTPPPAWALWERYLLQTMAEAARVFVRRYTRPDGTLVWRETWPGMDGSDDAYESFFNFPLLTALGGDADIDALGRAEWEAVTRQFTAYGQVYREFDAYYDWMHHGESSLFFYYFGLTDPTDLRMRARALRFAAMYMGEDPEADNYDPKLRLMRSPITGSRGPRYENSAEDWVTHRPILAHYPPPFDDVPGIPPDAKLADWSDDAIFGEILTLLNQRMMRGDVPLNLTATSLMAHAFLYTGEKKYADWVCDYTNAWNERAEANGGILPDNVGPSGKIGERMDGKWWGGYYGWRWPHGFFTLMEPATIAAANGLLLTGDTSYLELPRRLLDRVYDLGEEREGQHHFPNRRGDNGWYDFRLPEPTFAIHLWNLTMEEEDAARIERWRGGRDFRHVPEGRGKGDNTHTANWYHYMQGHFPEYPETILRVNHAEMCRRMAKMRADTTDPETWDVHHWQEINPIVCEGLVQLMLGGPNVIYHGGLLHCRLRYFDPDRKRAGIPPDVAALVSRVDAQGIEVTLVNLNPLEERRVTLQAGVFAEHTFTGVTLIGNDGKENDIALNGPHLEICLAPAAGGCLRLAMQRYVHPPTYAFPWQRRTGFLTTS